MVELFFLTFNWLKNHEGRRKIVIHCRFYDSTIQFSYMDPTNKFDYLVKLKSGTS